MLAAFGVWGTATGWPDILVAAMIATLFLNSATKILRQALGEWRLTQGLSTSDDQYGNLRTARRT
jgi:Co/Zn/Cd efflux system component